MIERVQGDPRLEGARVHAATALMRVSIAMTVASGIIGVILAQLLFGEGGVQFGLGMALGYAAYFGYLALRMDEPRIIGAMAALTDKKLVLIGSRKKGIVAEWKLSQLESVEMSRRGNIFVMGKMQITPRQKEPLTFLTTNRRMALDFVERFNEIRR